MSFPSLPIGTEMMEDQVAGHTFQDSAEAVGMLKSIDGTFVFKSHTKKRCGEREKSFYESFKYRPELAEMKRFVPTYYGPEIMNVRGRNVEFLKFSNLTGGMEQPCVIDCKIGKRTWDPLATEEKRLVESSKYVRCREKVGFCIPGFQVYSLSAGKVKRYGREYGKALDGDSVYGAFKLFLNADTALCGPLVGKILGHLKDIHHWAKGQRVFNIYSSSVLIVYDAKRLKELIEGRAILNNPNDLQLDEFVTPTAGSNWVNVKMIDFAHIFPNEDGGPDANYIEGIENLVKVFERLLSEANQN